MFVLSPFVPRSMAKHLESANTMFSFIWWVIGFYWVSADGQDLIHDSPNLYWFALSLSLSLSHTHTHKQTHTH